LAALRKRLKRGDVRKTTVATGANILDSYNTKGDLLKICVVRKICGRIFGYLKERNNFLVV
jgi:hypothetical protein